MGGFFCPFAFVSGLLVLSCGAILVRFPHWLDCECQLLGEQQTGRCPAALVDLYHVERGNNGTADNIPPSHYYLCQHLDEAGRNRGQTGSMCRLHNTFGAIAPECLEVNSIPAHKYRELGAYQLGPLNPVAIANAIFGNLQRRKDGMTNPLANV